MQQDTPAKSLPSNPDAGVGQGTCTEEISPLRSSSSSSSSSRGRLFDLRIRFEHSSRQLPRSGVRAWDTFALHLAKYAATTYIACVRPRCCRKLAQPLIIAALVYLEYTNLQLSWLFLCWCRGWRTALSAVMMASCRTCLSLNLSRPTPWNAWSQVRGTAVPPHTDCSHCRIVSEVHVSTDFLSELICGIDAQRLTSDHAGGLLVEGARPDQGPAPMQVQTHASSP